MRITFAYDHRFRVDFNKARSLASIVADGAFLFKGFSLNNGFSVKQYQVYKNYLRGKVVDDVEYWYCEFYEGNNIPDDNLMCYRTYEVKYGEE